MKTTAEMIEVMQAYERGEKVEACWRRHSNDWVKCELPQWDWSNFNFRIAPKPLECWIVTNINGSVVAYYESERPAKEHANGNCGKAIKMREVIE